MASEIFTGGLIMFFAFGDMCVQHEVHRVTVTFVLMTILQVVGVECVALPTKH